MDVATCFAATRFLSAFLVATRFLSAFLVATRFPVTSFLLAFTIRN
tara:strand:+ start:1848 stop:1985 length:138 start_codon:yes stop_codon:yes gene_type:complete